MPKALTREQLQTRKEKAVRFLEDVKHDLERADEVRGESLEHYAERRKIQLSNPSRQRGPLIREPVDRMAAKGQSKAELLERVQELEEENQELNEGGPGTVAAR
jgi:DNA anti-recombination protein RmuC